MSLTSTKWLACFYKVCQSVSWCLMLKNPWELRVKRLKKLKCDAFEIFFFLTAVICKIESENYFYYHLFYISKELKKGYCHSHCFHFRLSSATLHSTPGGNKGGWGPWPWQLLGRNALSQDSQTDETMWASNRPSMLIIGHPQNDFQQDEKCKGVCRWKGR